MGIDDERELSRLACGRDAEAFGRLVALHRPAALRVAVIVLGDPTGADDAVQDAVERVWRSIESLDPERGFRPWFLRSVANTARNHRRSRGRRTNLLTRSQARRDIAPVTPDESAVSELERRQVLAALAALDQEDRLVIGLRFIEQLSEAETAIVLDRPVGTVKSRSSRALARLRQQMVGLDDDG